MALGADLAHAMTPFGSFEDAGTNAIPGRLIDNDYSGGPAHSFTPYDSFEFGVPHAASYFGVQSATTRNFARVEFQSGDTYGDGGFFTGSLAVETSNDGSSWSAVSGLSVNQIDTLNAGAGASVVSAGYPNNDTSLPFKNYRLDFTPQSGKWVRVSGSTSGGTNTAGFTSCNELFVYEEEGSGVVDTTLALSGAATLAVQGSSIASATAAPAGSAALAVTGRAIASGAAALAGSASLVVQGASIVSTSVALSGGATVAVAGRSIASGAVALTGRLDMNVSSTPPSPAQQRANSGGLVRRIGMRRGMA